MTTPRNLATGGGAAPRPPAPPAATRRRWAWVALALLVQAALVATCVAPQVSARVVGQEYRLRVAPVDPIDPFRGAYVDLAYPDLPTISPEEAEQPRPRRRVVYVPLVAEGAVWRGGPVSPTRPASGPYLACRDRYGQLTCGISSWFVPEAQARRLQAAVAGGHAIAVVRVDPRGNAALVDLLAG